MTYFAGNKLGGPENATGPAELPSRRDFLGVAGALAVSLLGACSRSPEGTQLKGIPELFRERLPETGKIIAELARYNDGFNQTEYEAYFVKLLNAVNQDLEKHFGVAGLKHYTQFTDLEIAPTQEAAIAHGFLVTYYPTVSASTGKRAINVMVKAWGEETLTFDFTRFKADATLPATDFDAVSVRKFHTIFATPNFPMPVGTVVQTGPQRHSILIDEESVRQNARNADIAEQELLDDVIFNELGHYVLLRHFNTGASAAAQRATKIKLKGEQGVRDSIEFDEAFSDYCTFRFGATPIDYYILTYPSKVSVGQYALTNEIFLAGLNKAIEHHQADFAAAGLSGAQDWTAFASQLHHNPRLRVLQPSIKGFILGEYQALFRANLEEVTRQVRGR